MRFTLTITCDNASFNQLPDEAKPTPDCILEVARILHDCAQNIRHVAHNNGRRLMDFNGNCVGTAEFEGEPS